MLQNLRGVLGIGVTWGILWAAVATSVGMIIGVMDPDSIDAGEEPIVLGLMSGVVGFISGVVFAILLSVAERRKTILDLSLSRVAMWGILVGAALPLLTGKDIRMMLFTGPLGAVSATASVAIERKRGRWRSRMGHLGSRESVVHARLTRLRRGRKQRPALDDLRAHRSEVGEGGGGEVGH